MTDFLQTLKLLVVEDHEFQQNIIVQALKNLGIKHVKVAFNGLEAMAVLEEETIDILICDLNMPEMDGITLIQKLATEAPKTSIIISSSYDAKLVRSVEDMAKQYNLTVLGSLPKPISYALLETLVTSYLTVVKKKTPQHNNAAFTKEMLEDAIEEQQFELYFQPKVCLQTAELKSAEALVRWHHPERGIIKPNDFIPLMESSRLIDRLTLSLIDNALDQISEWRHQGRLISVAVNISPLMLDNDSLADTILQKTTDRKISPELLTLEISETGLIQNLGLALASLARLKMLGFSLSIDDFGIGYSSMEQLSRIPFSELKLDRSFVHNVSQDTVLEAIVDANLFMSRRLKLKTVAEGIETKEDWQLLQRLKCEQGQGYLIAKPMPAGDLDAWEQTWLSAPLIQSLKAETSVECNL